MHKSLRERVDAWVASEEGKQAFAEAPARAAQIRKVVREALTPDPEILRQPMTM